MNTALLKFRICLTQPFSDPPSSCSAGPQGDDLVRVRWSLVYHAKLTPTTVSLASHYHGTRKILRTTVLKQKKVQHS